MQCFFLCQGVFIQDFHDIQKTIQFWSCAAYFPENMAFQKAIIKKKL